MEYDRLATEVAASYEVFSAKLTAVYLQMRLQGQGGSMTSSEYTRLAQGLVKSFITAADASVARYLNTVAGGALTDTTITGKAALLLTTLKRFAIGNLHQARPNRGAPVPDSTGPFAQLMKKKAEAIQFTSKDSADRTWQTASLIRFMVRDFGYQIFIDAQIQSFKNAGIDLAQISYTQPDHAHNGTVISISGVAGYPALDEVRKLIFHPNAHAQLIHVHA
jgi:hypothetical protein